MARKNKGAALYELLFREKGKSTSPDGALKLPSWFQTKGQTQQAQVPQPKPIQPQPAAPAAPAAHPAHAAQPRPGQQAPVAAPSSVAAPAASAGASPAPAAAARPRPSAAGKTVAPSPAPSDLADARATTDAKAAAEAKPSGVTLQMTPPLARPPAEQPAWPPAAAPGATRPSIFAGPGPWLRLEAGRFRLDLSNFAALISLGVAVCLLLVSFILGVRAARPKTPAVNPQAGVASVEDARKLKPEPAILKPAPPTRAADNTAKPPGPTNNAAGQAAHPVSPPSDDPDAMVAGKSYVMIHSFGGNRTAGEKTAEQLKAKGYDVVVRQQRSAEGEVYSVRTRVGMDKAAADKVAEELVAVIEDLAKQPALGINPKSKPYVKTVKATP